MFAEISADAFCQLVGLDDYFFEVVEGKIILMKVDRMFGISTCTSAHVHVELPGRKTHLCILHWFIY